QEGDLPRCQLRTFFGHDIVGVEAGNEFDDQALFTFAGNHRRPGFAAFEQSLARIDSEMAFITTASVALDATGFGDRPYVFAEVDLRGRRRTQALELVGGEFSLRGRATGEPES